MASASKVSGKRQTDSKGKGKATEADMEIDEIQPEDSESQDEVPDDTSWKAQAYVSGVNYHAKKMAFLLFINSKSILDTCTYEVFDLWFRPACRVAAYKASYRNRLQPDPTKGCFTFRIFEVCLQMLAGTVS